MNSFLKTFICLAIYLSAAISELHAQLTVEGGAERMELVRIANLYDQVPYLSYRLQYLFADSTAPGTILDSSNVNCQLMSGKSFLSDSSTEILDDNYKYLYLNKEDSTIVLARAQSHSIMQLPLLDSIFSAVQVSNITVTNLGDSTRKLTVIFKPFSSYHSYQITYNFRSYLISQIKYYTESNGDFDLPAGHTVSTTVNVSNYSTAMIDPAVFNINRYVYFLNGQYYPQPTYQQYQVTTNQ